MQHDDVRWVSEAAVGQVLVIWRAVTASGMSARRARTRSLLVGASTQSLGQQLGQLLRAGRFEQPSG
jgi:hypothetical protein